MTIRIAVSNKVKFPVKGTFKDENGIDQPFDFTLTCKRFSTSEEFDQFIAGKKTTAVLCELTEDWSGVKAPEGGPDLPYSVEMLQQLLALPGMHHLVYMTYLAEAGARAKN